MEGRKMEVLDLVEPLEIDDSQQKLDLDGAAYIVNEADDHALELDLDRIVVTACSPLLHEKTFRTAAEDAGMNPFKVQMANIREHRDRGAVT